MIQRKDKIAMSWRLEKHEEEGAELPMAPSGEQQRAAGEPCWGPGLLWVPTALQQVVSSADPLAEAKGEPAGSVELGEDWSKFGVKWCWAHDGIRENGWFRLCTDGQLETRW